MEFLDEDTPVYKPDFDPGAVSDDTMFETSSSSNVSMSTISSNQVAEYFQSINGFLFSADESVPSVFPVHPDTIRAALLGHILFRLTQDGKNVHPEAALALLTCEETGGARVLQMMTNIGIWVQEMAQEYPNATFVSVDTKPVAPHKPHPRIKFEVYDVYAGIAEPDNSFDLVRATSCLLETRNFDFLLREMHRVLKPNGTLVLMEIPFKSFEAECPPEPRRPSPNRDQLERLVGRAFELLGMDLTVLDSMSDRLSPDHSHWSERSIDPVVGLVERPYSSGGVRGFHSIVQRILPIPDGPWHEDGAQREIGSLMRSLLAVVWRITSPMLCITGMEQGDAQRVVEEALEELKDTKIHRYIKCYRWSARKIPV